MPLAQLDRRRICFKSLQERKDKVYIERDHIAPGTPYKPLTGSGPHTVAETIVRLRQARDAGKPRMLAFGAHTIKNGLSPVLIRLIETGWLTHLATNGAGIIHDWEFAFQGHSSEDVRANVSKGQFGTWQETGFYLNLALNIGAKQGLGYGESIGKMVESEGLDVPSQEELRAEIQQAIDEDDFEQAAASSDLLYIMREFELNCCRLDVKHPFKRFGLQAAAYRLGVPFTSHPMFGHDIIYEHPMNYGAALGRAAQRDFLAYAEGISRLEGGVYLSLGSAVMSPMIFEKSFSMAQNIALQEGRQITRHFILVVDLQASHWDWSKGEPPEDNPDYYLRYNKTFSRMGGEMRYLSADNRDFLLALLEGLEA